MMAEGFDAADTRRASARAIIAEWTAQMMDDDASQSRPQNGYDALLAALTAALRDTHVRLQLQSIVQTVQWSQGQRRGRGHLQRRAVPSKRAARDYHVAARACCSSRRRSPAACASRRRWLRNTARSSASCQAPWSNSICAFAQRFWEELAGGRYRNAEFFHAAHEDFPTFWTQLPLRAPLLVAWAGGPRAARLCSTGGLRDLVARALDGLQSMFGKPCPAAAELEGAYYHDWQHDPFACGAYSYAAVDGDKTRALLAAPLADTLFFAGEATDTQQQTGTVSGAVESGIRAAREVLAL